MRCQATLAAIARSMALIHCYTKDPAVSIHTRILRYTHHALEGQCRLHLVFMFPTSPLAASFPSLQSSLRRLIVSPMWACLHHTGGQVISALVLDPDLYQAALHAGLVYRHHQVVSLLDGTPISPPLQGSVPADIPQHALRSTPLLLKLLLLVVHRKKILSATSRL
jgi:hypothetical protein